MARAVREGVLERFPGQRVELFCVWTHVLDTDNYEGAQRASQVFDDPRVYQFHDPERRLGRSLAESISMPSIREVCKATGEELSLYEGIMDPDFITGPASVFDTVFFYGPEARWSEEGAEVPAHASWVTQLDPAIYVGVDGERFRYGDALQAEMGVLAEELISASSPARRPNVLFILADDLRTELGCYGGPNVSPQLDALAEQGRLFTHAYAQSPESNHSRISLLSGQRPPSTGSFEKSFWPELDLVMLPELMSANGYETIKSGKILQNVRRKRLQREAMGSEAHDRRIWSRTVQAVLASPKGQKRKGAKKPQAKDEKTAGGGITYGTSGDDFLDHHDGRIAQAAARFLRERSPDADPFFLAVGFTKPRLPFVVPAAYYERISEIEFDLEEVPFDDLDDVPGRALEDVKRRDIPDPEQRREAIRSYLASVAYIDDCIGRLLEGLRAGGHADNTIVVVTSDNGQLLGEHDLWRESVLFEEALRVPLVISVPKSIELDDEQVFEPGPCEGLVELVDLYPTLLELCGIPLADDLEGASLLPLLGDAGRSWKPRVFSHVRHGDTLRSPGWRLTRWDNGSVELYDHRTDRAERTNLSRAAGTGSALARLLKELTLGWKESLPE